MPYTPTALPERCFYLYFVPLLSLYCVGMYRLCLIDTKQNLNQPFCLLFFWFRVELCLAVEHIHMKHVICPFACYYHSSFHASAIETDGFFRWDHVRLAPVIQPTLHLYISRHLSFPVLFTLLSHLSSLLSLQLSFSFISSISEDLLL